jgi:nucleoside-diphosphate-sugar epimerase
MMELRGESMNVVVTGATGFIGGRLVEALVSRRVKVTALVRNFSKVARIARFGIPMVRADLLQPDSFAPALKGADVVFHCGYGFAADKVLERRTNVHGTLNLARQALHHGVRRFVHVSTMAVYGHDLPASVTEETVPRPTTPYGRIKLEIEEALQQLARTSDLDVRIARPTKVYGPYDFNFTVPTVQKLIEKRLWLIENGDGIVTPSYVDNLVQGLLLCAEKEGLKHGVYNLADGSSMTWAEFYRRFSEMTGAGPCGAVTRAQCEAVSRIEDRRPGPLALLRATVLSQEARALYPKLGCYPFLRRMSPKKLVDGVKRMNHTTLMPEESSAAASAPGLGEYRDFTRRGAFSIDRAERELGYRPKVGMKAAMASTEAWLRFAHILGLKAALACLEAWQSFAEIVPNVA